jgi:predicted aspartyl protease
MNCVFAKNEWNDGMLRSLLSAIVAIGLFLGAAGCAAGSGAGLPRAEVAKVHTTEAAPFFLDGDQIVVSGKLNGQETRLLLDTGATTLALKPSAARRLGLEGAGEMHAFGFGGDGKVSRALAGSLDLGAVVSSNVPAAIIPLPDFFEWDGLLGLSFLNGFKFGINFDEERIAFHKATETNLTAAAFLPMRAMGGAVVIEAEANGAKGWFMVDTGAGDGLILNPRFVERSGLRKTFPKIVAINTGIGLFGETMGEVARAQSLKVGPWTITNTFTELAEVGMADRSNFAGVIGMATLMRFNLVFDLPGGWLGLTPSKKYFEVGRVSAFERTGMMLLPTKDSKFVARSMIENSPAARAGLKVGDTLLEIDGVAVSSMRPNAIRIPFRAEKGTRVKVRVQSGVEEPRDAVVELGDAF